jgi:hypothetical protein
VDGQPESALAFRVHADKVEKRGYTSSKDWPRPWFHEYR